MLIGTLTILILPLLSKLSDLTDLSMFDNLYAISSNNLIGSTIDVLMRLALVYFCDLLNLLN